MARAEFTETMVLPLGPGGSFIPVPGVGMTPHMMNPDGSEGTVAAAYANRTGSTAASTTVTDAAGQVSYWLETGDYNIHIDDSHIPPRFTSFIRGFIASPLLDMATLSSALENVAVFVGDLKSSMQTADHGLKPDSTYEWLLIRSESDGLGRLVRQSDYTLLWSEIGEPALDGDGKFRLPNLSGRALIATGGATGLSVRSLMAMFGSENHHHSVPDLSLNGATSPHAHGLEGTGGAAVQGEPSGLALGDAAFGLAFDFTQKLPGTWTTIEGSGTHTPVKLVGNTNPSTPALTGVATGANSSDVNGQPPSVGMNLFVKT